MGSSRDRRCTPALAWIDPAAGADRRRAGRRRAAPLGAPPAQPSSPTRVAGSACLGFVAGQGRPARSVYYRYSTRRRQPRAGRWSIAMADGGGRRRSRSTVPARHGQDPSCPRQRRHHRRLRHRLAGQLGQLARRLRRAPDRIVTPVSSPRRSTSAARTLQPPLVGLAPCGDDFAVAARPRPRAAEAWRVDAAGQPQPGALTFPSLTGQHRARSRPLPLAGSLYATYADYTPERRPSAGGQRFSSRRPASDALRVPRPAAAQSVE